MIAKHLTGKGEEWPLYATVAVYALNTFASPALSGFSLFEFLFYAQTTSFTYISISTMRTIYSFS